MKLCKIRQHACRKRCKLQGVGSRTARAAVRSRAHWVAAALSLGVGLSGIHLCSCVPQAAVEFEAHGCCPHSGALTMALPSLGPA